ncbi:MAG: F0F1 ATP synthase subunit gamma, partial [Gammaproteobacteria bacterium]|nr:F0F1 ATP synthase subunit gamma [Gammaproteobacteria bacterium]
MAAHVGGILLLGRSIAAALASASTVDTVFAQHQKLGACEVRARRILPLDPALLEHSTTSGPPLHHIAAETFLQRLADEYLFSEVTRILMESLASENGARLRIMESADHNIADKLDETRKTALWQRQDAITSELLDVVIGSEAILGESGH